jgi:TonB family protein
MPPCGRTRACALLIVVFATVIQDVRAAKTQQPAQVDERAVLISGMEPEYPDEARKRRITGRGVVSMKIDAATGNVTSCEMLLSTGSPILDEAALSACRQWRFKPGGPAKTLCPIEFTLIGVQTDFHTKEKSTDDALAAFLGKGTVEKGPMPRYAWWIRWSNKRGKGVYEIHVRKDGTVSEVKILKRSGDVAFDLITVKTLQRWRFRRGPLIVELPLAFSLTPTHYSVAIPKER